MVASFGADFKPLALFLARENSRVFAKLPLVSRRKYVRVTNAKIPYWWRVSTQFWLVLPTGRTFFNSSLFRLVFCKEQLKEPTVFLERVFQTHQLFMQSKANKWRPFGLGRWIFIPNETPPSSEKKDVLVINTTHWNNAVLEKTCHCLISYG